ncbi:ABC transporter substrate-binding protein [Stella sp.]|uniref:ABC transporter substrate-binding protein n=1 Tax=Stella sp. TaxID=2912054 RepID=UPI0035AE9F26
MIERRSLLGLAVAAMVGVAAGPAAADLAKLYEAAKKDGEVTWYVAHYTTQQAEETGRAFEKKYPGIKANVVRTTAQVAYQRLNQDIAAGVAKCDVFSSTDIGHYVELKKKGLLMAHKPENAAKVAEPFQNFDPDGLYYPTAAGLIVIGYRTDKLKPEELPKNWTDLLDPKWRNKVATGHPGFSGYVGTWVVTMEKLYGWSFFEKLEKNRPQIGRSINDTVTMLNAGERLVAFGPTATTLESADRGNPVGVIYPTDGSLLMISPSAIMKNTTKPNAAKLFMEFLLDVEHAEVAVKNRQESLRPEVKPLPGAKPFTEFKVIRPSDAEVSAGIPKAIEKWRDLFGG